MDIRSRITRQFWIRLAAVVLIILLGVWMYHIGKQHFILIDNKTENGYKALKTVVVEIDDGGEIEMTPRMREQAEVTGQKHTIRVTWTDEYWEEHTIERRIKLPLEEHYVLVSVPALVGDPEGPQDEWLTHFEPLSVQREESADEAVVTDEFGGITSEF